MLQTEQILVLARVRRDLFPRVMGGWAEPWAEAPRPPEGSHPGFEVQSGMFPRMPQ